MPKVHTTVARKDYPEHGIAKGETYYHWTPYRGSKHYSKTPPLPSQTCGSRWAEVYAHREAIEAAQAAIDLHDAIQNAADEIDGIADEYEQAAEPFGGQCPNQERADALHELASGLEDAASGMEDVECPRCSGNGTVKYADLSPEEKEAATKAAREAGDLEGDDALDDETDCECPRCEGNAAIPYDEADDDVDLSEQQGAALDLEWDPPC